jgi:eukaryotic-like serine/threonine-protein kinase
VTFEAAHPKSRASRTGATGGPLGPRDPTMIGSYAVIARLGAGGMGTVYLCRSSAGRNVAVKVIKPELAVDPMFRRRFADEVDAARRVAPFCTAQVLDADPSARLPYLVTEYIEGERLDRAVGERGALPLSALQGVAVGVASALTAIHGAGIIHRDLKPSNVLLSYSGPRVIDFGIARSVAMSEGLTRSGSVLGSAGWMAPEQVLGGRVGPSADVFAWGLLVAWAGTNRHPYGDGPSFDVAYRVATGYPDLDGVPAALRSLVAAALTKDAARRPSAERLLLALLGDHRAPDTRAAVTEVMGGAGFGAGIAAAAPAPTLRPTLVGPPASLPGGREAYERPMVPAGRVREREIPERGGRGRDGRGREVRGRDAAAERPYGPAGYAPRPRPARPEPEPPAPRTRRPRRRFRLPFKRLIVMIILVLLLMSMAGRIRGALRNETNRLWESAWTSIRGNVQHQIVDRVTREFHKHG